MELYRVRKECPSSSSSSGSCSSSGSYSTSESSGSGSGGSSSGEYSSSEYEEVDCPQHREPKPPVVVEFKNPSLSQPDNTPSATATSSHEEVTLNCPDTEYWEKKEAEKRRKKKPLVSIESKISASSVSAAASTKDNILPVGKNVKMGALERLEKNQPASSSSVGSKDELVLFASLSEKEQEKVLELQETKRYELQKLASLPSKDYQTLLMKQQTNGLSHRHHHHHHQHNDGNHHHHEDHQQAGYRPPHMGTTIASENVESQEPYDLSQHRESGQHRGRRGSGGQRRRGGGAGWGGGWDWDDFPAAYPSYPSYEPYPYYPTYPSYSALFTPFSANAKKEDLGEPRESEKPFTTLFSHSMPLCHSKDLKEAPTVDTLKEIEALQSTEAKELLSHQTQYGLFGLGWPRRHGYYPYYPYGPYPYYDPLYPILDKAPLDASLPLEKDSKSTQSAMSHQTPLSWWRHHRRWGGYPYYPYYPLYANSTESEHVETTLNCPNMKGDEDEKKEEEEEGENEGMKQQQKPLGRRHSGGRYGWGRGGGGGYPYDPYYNYPPYPFYTKSKEGTNESVTATSSLDCPNMKEEENEEEKQEMDYMQAMDLNQHRHRRHHHPYYRRHHYPYYPYHEYPFYAQNPNEEGGATKAALNHQAPLSRWGGGGHGGHGGWGGRGWGWGGGWGGGYPYYPYPYYDPLWPLVDRAPSEGMTQKEEQSLSSLAEKNTNETKAPYHGYGTFASSLYYYGKDANQKMKSNATADPLVNINSLPPEQQAVIVKNSETSKKSSTFANKSLLAQKKQFEAMQSMKVMSPAVSSLFHGLPMNATKAKDSSSSSLSHDLKCPLAVLDVDGICGKMMMEYIQTTYPDYYNLLVKGNMLDRFEELMHRHDLIYLVVVPVEATLNLCVNENCQVIQRELARFIILIDAKSGLLDSDGKTYSCETLLKGVRTLVRRKDANTLELDNLMEAQLDHASKKRIYTIVETVPSSDEAPIEETIVKVEEVPETSGDSSATTSSTEEVTVPTTTTTTTPEESAAGESAATTPASTTVTTTTTTTTPETPAPTEATPPLEVVSELPAATAPELKPVEVKEESSAGRELAVVSSRNINLSALTKHSQYSNQKLENLTKPMLAPKYNPTRDMANFIEHRVSGLSANKNQSSSKTAAATTEVLFLKLYSYQDAFKKYQNATLQENEKLTLKSHHIIETQEAHTYKLDSGLKMREFLVPSEMQLSKSEFVHHLCVLAFQNKKDNQYSVAYFHFPNNLTKTDVYMSSDENVLLRFHLNNLQSISLNTDESQFITTAPSGSLQQRQLILSKARGEKASHRHHHHRRHHRRLHYLREPILSHISAELALGPSYEKMLYEKDIFHFESFLEFVVPLSLPKFIKKAQAVSRSVFQTEWVLKKSDVKPDFRDYNEIEEYTVNVTAGIATGVLDMVRGNRLKTYVFHRIIYQNENMKTQDYIDRYEFDSDQNKKNGPIDFNTLAGQGKSKVLSITLDDPMKPGTRTFLFKLATIRDIMNVAFYRSLVDNGLDFYFELEKGLLKNIYIKYNKSVQRKKKGLFSAPTLENANPTSKFENEMTNFLVKEASAYSQLGLDVGYSFMRTRMTNLLTPITGGPLKIDYNKRKAAAFFKALATAFPKEISHEEQQQFSSPLKNGHSGSKTTISQSSQDIMVNNNYLVPLFAKEGSALNALMSSGFKYDTSATCDAKTLLPKILASWNKLNQKEYLAHCSRLKFIVNTIVAELEK